MSKNELLQIALQTPDTLDIALQTHDALDVTLHEANPLPGTRNYENLVNKPQINGIDLSGDKSSIDLKLVSENTEAGWAARPTYIPKRGEICLYSDITKIKIGDGYAAVGDLPFIGSNEAETFMSMLIRHSTNSTIHVTKQDKDRWNNKLNYALNGESLILTRE